MPIAVTVTEKRVGQRRCTVKLVGGETVNNTIIEVPDQVLSPKGKDFVVRKVCDGFIHGGVLEFKTILQEILWE